MAVTLLTVVAFAAIMGGFLLTTKAADTTSTTDTNTAASTANGNGMDFPPWNNGSMGFGRRGFGGGPGGGFGGFGGCGPIEVSAEFEQKVTDIANNDTDVQNLLADGYNITAIRPIIKNVVDADGYVTMKATSAIVMLQKDTSGCASVSVDIEEAKVTQIVILTRTVIEKP
jgi:hypothetical protein